jgi:hypothetical protein
MSSRPSYRSSSQQHYDKPSPSTRQAWRPSPPSTAFVQLSERMVVPLAIDHQPRECGLYQCLTASLDKYNTRIKHATATTDKNAMAASLAFRPYMFNSSSIEGNIVVLDSSDRVKDLVSNGMPLYELQEDIDFWYGMNNMGAFTYMDTVLVGRKQIAFKPVTNHFVDVYQRPLSKRFSPTTLCITSNGCEYHGAGNFEKTLKTHLANLGLAKFDDTKSDPVIDVENSVIKQIVFRYYAKHNVKSSNSTESIQTTYNWQYPVQYVAVIETDCWQSCQLLADMLKACYIKKKGKASPSTRVGFMLVNESTHPERRRHLLPESLLDTLGPDWHNVVQVEFVRMDKYDDERSKMVEFCSLTTIFYDELLAALTSCYNQRVAQTDEKKKSSSSRPRCVNKQ